MTGSGMGCRFEGLGFTVQDRGNRVEGSGCREYPENLTAPRGVQVWGLGLGV